MTDAVQHHPLLKALEIGYRSDACFLERKQSLAADGGIGDVFYMNRPGSQLLAEFDRLFGGAPEWQVKAPGRVNLIGDHTDYNHLPVFPMAIQRRVCVLGRSRQDNLVRVANVDGEFARVDFELSAGVAQGVLGSWENYVKAGPRALAEEHGSRLGFDGLIWSDLPVAAGLSSSSALVVACGLAVCRANSIELPALVMAELMASAERFVGTQGGGMDQAVCLGGCEGCAVRIDFAPLRLDTVAVPDDWQFVVAHSLVRAEKSGSAQEEYNRRTDDCRRGFQLVTAALTVDKADGASDFPALIAAHGADAVLATAASVLSGSLLTRFRHTVSEAGRVERAVSAMRANDREQFGRLMIASHESLRRDYEVSLPVLDELVDVMVTAGCEGARLTGAGFGGCVVGLCAAEQEDAIHEAIVERFYGRRGLHQDALDDLIFTAEPSAGAKVSAMTS